jgi:hypothetical protein
MRKLKLMLAATVVAATSLSFAAPANAMVCIEELRTPCSVAATLVCGVVAKGKPCLN